LFDTGGTRIQTRPVLPAAEPWGEAEKLSREKSVLGFYVSGHPLESYREEIEAFANARLGEPTAANVNSTVRICGIVSSVKKKIDRRGNAMAFITLEDFTGKGEGIVFADTFKKYANLLNVDSMVMAIGKGEVNGDSLKVLVNEILPMERVREQFTKSVSLTVDLDKVSEATIVELRKILEAHRGKCLCYLHVNGGGLKQNSLYLTRRHVVNPNKDFVLSVKRLLGPTAVRLQG
jgi:DNA polymerase-3 subunit alpha